MTVEDKLKIIRSFQQKFPGSHVGGSLGLMLQGVDLQRDLKKSDIDMTVQTELQSADVTGLENTEESSHPEDFDYQFRHYPTGTGTYVKIDINIQPKRKYNTVVYKGESYRVSRIEDILAWKHYYSMKGAGKHTDDLEVLRTGVRSKEVDKPVVVTSNAMDDLPF